MGAYNNNKKKSHFMTCSFRINYIISPIPTIQEIVGLGLINVNYSFWYT